MLVGEVSFLQWMARQADGSTMGSHQRGEQLNSRSRGEQSTLLGVA